MFKIFKDELIGNILPCKLKDPIQPNQKLEFNEYWKYIYEKNRKQLFGERRDSRKKSSQIFLMGCNFF